MNQDNADLAMPSSARVERRIWWFTVSNATDRSSRMSTNENDDPLVPQMDSVTALKPD